MTTPPYTDAGEVPNFWQSFSLSHKRIQEGGWARQINVDDFPISKDIAALVTIRPGGVRELHWHQNAGEWQYWLRGTGRVTLFATSGKARTADFHPGDVGYMPFTQGHYIENTGPDDLVYLAMFRSDRYQDLTLNQWLTHTTPELVMQHLRISHETLDAIPRDKYEILPA